LMRVLQVPQYAAVGILESVWHLTAREATQGNIGRLSDEDIAAWLDWQREPAELIDALVTAGWLDRCPEHRLVVHDWAEHADDATKKAMARQREKTANDGGNVATCHDSSEQITPAIAKPVPMPVPMPEPKPVAARRTYPRSATTDVFVLPTWVDPDAWAGFEEMRNRLGKPMTSRARQLVLEKLTELRDRGNAPTAVLNQSILNGWQGVFELKGAGSEGKQRAVGSSERQQRIDDETRASFQRLSSQMGPLADSQDGIPEAGTGAYA
jgi:hypothetical protein